MSELSKQALQVENTTSFPNNATGYITPTLLRGFNSDMIDSTVNQAVYTTDSGSWNVSISQLNTFTSSQQPTFNALNVFTASQLNINTGYNSFTQSAGASITSLGSEIDVLQVWSSSINEIRDDGVLQGYSTRLYFNGLVSASVVQNVGGAIANITIEQDGTKLNTASFNEYTASNQSTFNTYTQSVDTRLDSLEEFSSSLDNSFVSEVEFNVYTSSNDAKVNGLLSGSYATTGSNVFVGNQVVSGSMYLSGSMNLVGEGANGFAYSGKALFLTNSVQTGITVESPIHFYQVGKGDFYIQNNVAGVGSGSMNITAANGATLNISSSTLNVTAPSMVVTSTQPRFTAGLQVTGAVNLQSDVQMLETTGTTTLRLGPIATVGEGTGIALARNNTNRNSNIQLYASSSAFVTVAASGSTYWNAISIQSTATGSNFSDYTGTGYSQFLNIPPNVGGSNPSPIFPRGLTVTGSISNNVVSASIVSSTASIDFSTGNFFRLSIPASTTTHINVQNMTAGKTGMLEIATEGAAATASFSTNVYQPNTSYYVPTNGAGVDILTLASFDSNKAYVVSVKNMTNN